MLGAPDFDELSRWRGGAGFVAAAAAPECEALLHEGGMLSMRAGSWAGKGRAAGRGMEAGNDRLAWRAPQALSGRGGQAGQPGRLRCLFAKRLRRERRRGAGAGIVRLGISIVLRCRVQAEEAEGLRLRWPASLSMAVAAAHRRGMLARVAGQVWAAAQHGGPRGIAGSKAGPGGSPVSTAAAVRLRGVQSAAAGVWRGGSWLYAYGVVTLRLAVPAARRMSKESSLTLPWADCASAAKY
jgi:hypothetical protein